MTSLLLIYTLLWCSYVLFWTSNFCVSYYFKRFYPQYRICPKWDCQVSNWLIEDDLKIKFQDYNVYGHFEEVCSIQTPIGEVWVGNFPYAFGHQSKNCLCAPECQPKPQAEIVMPSWETRIRLKEKLISMGLSLSKEKHCFILPTDMMKPRP